MKIALIITSFPPKWIAGTELATYNTAIQLVKKGHDVHVIASKDRGIPKKYKEQGFFVHRVYYPKIRYFGIVLFWFRAIFLLINLRPDIIQSQSIPNSIPALFCKKLFKIPVILSCRGSDLYTIWSPSVFQRPLSYVAIIGSNIVIALSEDMKRQIKEKYPREIIVIPNGLNFNEFSNSNKIDFKKEFNIKNDKKIIIYVGRLHPVKGLEYLIEAMKLIQETYPNSVLLLVGSDHGNKKNLEALIQKNNLKEKIFFTGIVPHEKIPAYLNNSHIFVLPSLSEGFPNVILEAMASGLPIVATRVGGIPEIIENEVNGFLVKPKDAKEIADKISLLLNDGLLRKSISLKNKKKAKLFSWEKVSERLEEIYENLTDK